MTDKLNLTNPSQNQILVYSDSEQAFINVEPAFVTGGMSLGTATEGESVFNNVVANTLRFKRLRGKNGIVLESLGSYIDISFDGDANTLEGLGRTGFLEKDNNLSDVNVVVARDNLEVYSRGEIDDKFLFANQNNVPDLDATYNLGANGRRYADIYAVTFHGLATESIVSQSLKRNGAVDGEVLTWDDTEGWVPRTSASNTLVELADTDLSNIQNESLLVYNGIRNVWESVPLSYLGDIGGDGTAGSISDAENVGSGVGTFFTRFGGNLQFRSVSAGDNVTVNTNFNNEEIVIAADVPQDTDELPEGSANLYFTNQRVRDALQTVSIQNLGSMDTNAPSNGQAPVWNGSVWQFQDVAVGVSSTDDLPEGITNLYYNTSRLFDDIDEYLVDVNYGINLGELKDANIVSPANKFLYNNGTEWVDKVIQLSDISNVDLTGVSNGDGLQYNSTTGKFEISTFPTNLIDLGETSQSLHFNQTSFDSFFSTKTTDDVTETSQNKFLNNTNLVTELGSVSVGTLSDVNITGISDNNILVWDANTNAFIPADSSSLNVSVNLGLEDLNNVNATSVTNAQEGYVLAYNGTNNEFEIRDNALSVQDLSDVNYSTVNDGQTLIYDSSAGVFVTGDVVPYSSAGTINDGYILTYSSTVNAFVPTANQASGASILDELNDVTITTPQNTDLFVYDGALSEFVNKPVSDVIDLSSLGDVNFNSLSVGQVVTFDGTNFVNESLDLLPHTLSSPSVDDILIYDAGTSQFVNTQITSVLPFNVSSPDDGDMWVYNTTNQVFEHRPISLSDVSDIAPGTLVDGEVNVLQWNSIESQYDIVSFGGSVSLSDITDVDIVNGIDNSVLAFNSSTGNYEIRQLPVEDLSNVDITNIGDGESLVWNTDRFVNGTPSLSMSNLTDVDISGITDGETIVWDSNSNGFTVKDIKLTYEELVKNTTAYEFWNFEETLTGIVSNYPLVPESGATVSYTSGINSTIGIQAGTSYSGSGTRPSLISDFGTLSLAESYTISYDFWYAPSGNIVYSGVVEDIIVASMSLVSQIDNSQNLEVRFVTREENGTVQHFIRKVRNGALEESKEVKLQGGFYNHIVVNYRKNGVNTDIDVFVNSKLSITYSSAGIISDDDYTFQFEALQELDTGSDPFSVDKLAVYISEQTQNDIDEKYRNVIGNGYAFETLQINDIDGFSIDTTPGTGQVLVYDGTNFSNNTISLVESLSELTDVDSALAPVDGNILQFNSTSGVFEAVAFTGSVSSINDLTDVDTAGITTGQILNWDGSQFIPVDMPDGSGTTPTLLGELSNVDTTGQVANDLLKFNGTNWLPSTVSYNELTDQPTLFSGSYNDLTDTPTFASVATSGNYNDLQNAPVIPSSVNDLGDVDTTGVVDGQVLVYNSTTSTFEAGSVSGSGASSLNELSDVDTSGLATNEVLLYNGSTWISSNVSYNDLTDQPTLFSGSYNDLTDTPTLATVATSGNYNDLQNAPVIPSSVNDLGDVDTTGVADGQVLVYNSTTSTFEAGSVSGSGASSLNELSDVDTTGLATNEVIKYNGTTWISDNVSYNELTDQPTLFSGSYNDLTDTPTLATVATSGDYNDLLNTPAIPSSVHDLGGVDTTGVADGQVLVYNSNTSTFEAGSVSGSGASSLNELNDVDTSGLATNEVIKYNGTTWISDNISYNELTDQPTLFSGSYNDLTDTPTFASVATSGDYNDLLNTPAIPSSVNDLGDVDTTGVVDGQVLVYNSTTSTFEAGSVSGSGASSLNELSDVDTSGLATNEVLLYNGSTWISSNVSYNDLTDQPTLFSGSYNDLADTPDIPSNIEDLNNVDTSGITSGQVLQFDGTNFVAATVSASGATNLDELSDVDTSGLALDEVLKYNGTTWVSANVSYNELTDQPTLFSGSYNDLTDTPTLATVATSGDYNDLLNTPSIPSSVNDLGDVDTSGVTDGQVLVYNDTTSTFEVGTITSGASSLNELSDVDTTGMATNEVIKYNGTTWVSDNVSYNDLTDQPTLFSGSYNDLTDTPVIPSSVNDLTDVTITTPTDNQFIRYNGTSFVNETVDLVNSVNDLSDVDTTGITSGQVLQFDGTNFVAASISGGSASTLDDLSDVDTTTTAPTIGDTLVYNGTEWVPQAPSGGSGGSGPMIERFKIQFETDDTVAGTVGTSEPYSEITSGITPVLKMATSASHVVTTVTFSGYRFPPANVLYYGYDAYRNMFVARSFNTTVNMHIQNNSGDFKNPDVFGNFQSLDLDTIATRMGVTHVTGFGSTAGWGYVVFIMQG